MERAEIIIEAIEEEGIDCILYVPCSTMTLIIDHFEKKDGFDIFPISREEEGVGMIMGLYLAGRKPLLLIQDSGLGNSYNAIVALLSAYQVPVPIMATRRGSIGEISAPNALWSDNTSAVNKILNLHEFLLGATVPIQMWKRAVLGAFYHAKLVNRPVIIQVNLRNRGEYRD